MSRGRGAVLAGGILVAIAFAVLSWRLHTSAQRYQAAALRGDSLEAVLDTTRVYALDDHNVQLRRIVQEEQRADALQDLADSIGGANGALRRQVLVEQRARYALTITIDSLAQLVTIATVSADSADSIRRAHFEQYQPPFRIAADAALPRAGGPGSLTTSIALDPLHLTARVACGNANAGIRPATLAVESPRWATVRLDSLSQDPAVCNQAKGLPVPRAGYGTWRLIKDFGLIALGLIGSHL